MLQLDHLFLFAIITTFMHRWVDKLQLDHLFLFAIMEKGSLLNVYSCSLTTFSYLL